MPVDFNYIIDNLWLQQKIGISLILISFLVGAIRYKKLYKPDRIFVWILFLEIITESVSIYTGFFLNKANFYCYNLFTIISFPLYLLYYKKLNIKFPFYILLSLFLIGVLVSLYFENFFNQYQFISFIFGAIIIIISVFYYFSHILKNKKLENLSKSASFLFSCGLLIYYLGMIPYILLSKYLNLSGFSTQTIVIFLNVILYTFYILAFLCSRRKTY